MYTTFDTDITIYTYRYNNDSKTDEWARHQYKNCSWYGGQKATVGDRGLNTADAYTVRIPAAEYDDAEINNGDIVIKGMHSEETPDAIDDKTVPRFVITSVNDNRRGIASVRHIRIDGK